MLNTLSTNLSCLLYLQPSLTTFFRFVAGNEKDKKCTKKKKTPALQHTHLSTKKRKKTKKKMRINVILSTLACMALCSYDDGEDDNVLQIVLLQMTEGNNTLSSNQHLFLLFITLKMFSRLM